MSVAKVFNSNSTDILRLEEGNDAVDTSWKQSVVKDPFISPTSAVVNQPIHLVQLFQALGHPASEFGGWPLLPVKVPMQKCDKCSREFCSPINGRRHVRVHHRQKNLDKDSVKTRELLGSFWDKLSEEEAKEIVSFQNLTFEGIPGAKIIKNLTSLILRPGCVPLPDCYNSAGAILLDLIQASRRTLLLSAQELFSILDDASEKTFLCGSALSMQKYIFDGEAAKIGLEAKNVVACCSFFVEQQLLKAWMADKDAEALRCQKLLVEEEEAAQRKRAELSERRRQKKLRQKARDTKVEEEKDQLHEELDSRMIGASGEQPGNFAAPVAQTPVLAEAADQVASSLETPVHTQDFEEVVSKAEAGAEKDHLHEELDSRMTGAFKEQSGNFAAPVAQTPVLAEAADQVASSLETPVHIQDVEAGVGSHYINQGTSQNIKQQQLQRNSHHHPVNGRWKVTSRSHASSRGFHGGLHPPHPRASRTEVERNHEIRDIRAAPTVKTNKVLMESKPDNDEIVERNHEIRDIRAAPTVKTNKLLVESKPDNDEIVKFKVTDGSSQQGSQNEKQELLIGSIPVTIGSRKQVSEPEAQDNDLALADINGKICKDQVSVSGTLAEGSGTLLFSIDAARDFLARRWKEALAGDHVKLVLLPEPITEEGSPEAPNASLGISDSKREGVLGSSENSNANGVAVEPVPSGNGKANFGGKRTAGLKKRYVPKLRAGT